jgi:hypothetical protein
MRKLPNIRSFQLLGHTINIETEPDVLLREKGHSGMAFFPANVIRIQEGAGIAESNRELIIVHEILEMIAHKLNITGLQGDENHDDLDRLAEGLLQVFKTTEIE